MRWAVRVRWAVIGGFSALALVFHVFGLFPDLAGLAATSALGVLANGINHVCVRRGRGIVVATAFALVMDNALITYAAACTGGLHSPMVLMYSIQVVATAMLVTARTAVLSAGVAAACATSLVVLEGDAGAIGPWLLYSSTLAADPVTAARLGAVAWTAFLAYGLSLLVFVGGFVSERLRRSEVELAERNQRLAQTVTWLEAARDELAAAYGRLQQAEAQLVQTEKMRALGQVVAGVAHELNNPISFVASNVDSLRRYFKCLKDFVERRAETAEQATLENVLNDIPSVLDDCEEGARRVKRIVGELRSFSRRDDSDAVESVDLNGCIERSLRVLRHHFHGEVRLELDLGHIPAVCGQAGPLEQVLLNLIVNAVEALSGAGTVRVSSAHDPRARTVRVTVADTGTGTAAEHLERVFEPFFTTKPVGKGTGIGLSLAYAIAERHGGRLSVSSPSGGGAVFELSLPCGETVNSVSE